MPRNYLISALFLVLISIHVSLQDVESVIKKRNEHQPAITSDFERTIIANLNDHENFNYVLENILVERVAGTGSHGRVKDFIVENLKNMKWHIELDEFEDETPMGRKPFKNIVATINPDAERFLVLACHYDSKYFNEKEKVFLGATDSAVPCSMLLNIAHVMKDSLDKAKSNNDLSLMFIFFDGEEAFVQWTATDSIYGARHLAKKWEDEGFLHRIDMLMLLDLLGSSDPQFYSLNPETMSWYMLLSETEQKLSKAGLLDRYTTSGVTTKNPNQYFNEFSIQAGIEDDHVPFMQRDVPILHLIPVPFPPVWHKFEDDRKAIDDATCENLMKIFRIYIFSYLHLDIDD